MHLGGLNLRWLTHKAQGLKIGKRKEFPLEGSFVLETIHTVSPGGGDTPALSLCTGIAVIAAPSPSTLSPTDSVFSGCWRSKAADEVSAILVETGTGGR
jgi:hypothetical protein